MKVSGCATVDPRSVPCNAWLQPMISDSVSLASLEPPSDRISDAYSWLLLGGLDAALFSVLVDMVRMEDATRENTFLREG